MKNISSTTENFIREQVALKFKKQLNALKKKKTALDGKWHDISQQIYDLTEQMDNVGGMSDRQFNEVEKLEEDLTDIVRKSCAKTIADRLKQIGLKMKDEKKTIECILDCSGLLTQLTINTLSMSATMPMKSRNGGRSLLTDAERSAKNAGQPVLRLTSLTGRSTLMSRASSSSSSSAETMTA